MARDVAIQVVDRDGEPVVRKVAQSAEAAARLRRERERIDAAGHDGVVEVLDSTDDPPTLVLRWAGGRSLETARPDVGTAAEILATVASTVADLHDRDIVHGRIEPSHVVLDGRRRPRLCGMAGVDPDRPRPTPADDVAALGSLITYVVGNDSDSEPVPDRRWPRRRWEGYARGILLTLADHASDPDPDRRPSARRLARSLAEVVPARPDRSGHGREDPPADRRTPRDRSRVGARPIVLAALIIGSIVVAVLGLRHARPTDPTTTSVAAADQPGLVEETSTAPADSPSTTIEDDGVVPEPKTSTTRPVDSTTTTSTTEPRRSCAKAAGPFADVDGDGCPEAVRVDGGNVSVGAVTFHIGGVHDRVAVGDWNCDGTATPAAVRPDTGEIYVFGGWFAPGEPVSSEPTAQIDGVVAPTDPMPKTCGAFRVRTKGGKTIVIPDLQTGR